MELNQVIQGEAIDEMRKLHSGSIDAVVCDPPYGTTACRWDTIIPFEPMWEQLKRITKKNGAIVLFGSQPFTSALVMSNPKMFKYEWVWEKSKCGSPLSAKYRPLQKHENILVFGNGKTTYNPQMTDGKPYKRVSRVGTNNMKYGASEGYTYGSPDGKRHPKTVQFFEQKWRRQDQIHPTQKPVALMEYLIKTYTNEGEVVLDFAAGSGTTGVAAKNLKRNYILIEKEAQYVEIARERLKK